MRAAIDRSRWCIIARWGFTMKRDMDLIRAIALAIEDEPSGWAPSPLTVEGFTEQQVGYHALLMIEGGLAVGVDDTSFGGSPSGTVTRLTWEGCEFLEAAREPSRWEKAKTIFAKVGGVTYPVVMEVLTKLATKAINLP